MSTLCTLNTENKRFCCFVVLLGYISYTVASIYVNMNECVASNVWNEEPGVGDSVTNYSIQYIVHLPYNLQCAIRQGNTYCVPASFVSLDISVRPSKSLERKSLKTYLNIARVCCGAPQRRTIGCNFGIPRSFPRTAPEWSIVFNLNETYIIPDLFQRADRVTGEASIACIITNFLQNKN